LNAPRPEPQVLIVEDEWLLAELLEATVRSLGFNVVGPAATVDSAFDLLERERITMAVLDVSLGGARRSFPIARKLKERNVPFIFITGYLRTDLPPEFGDQKLLSKPLSLNTVGPALKAMLA
jgi:DNA-binding response OmpR family regulator